MRNVLALSMLVLAPLLMAADGGSVPSVPTGGVLFLLIAAARKEKAIGSWLWLFHASAVTSIFQLVVAFVVGHENFLYQSWFGQTKLYALYLMSTLPGFVLAPITLFLAERLRRIRLLTGGDSEVRRSTALAQLRIALWLTFVTSWLAVAIDVIYFEDMALMSILGTFWATVWPLYFMRSERVKQVYVTQSWPNDEPLVPVSTMPMGAGAGGSVAVRSTGGQDTDG